MLIHCIDTLNSIALNHDDFNLVESKILLFGEEIMWTCVVKLGKKGEK